MIKAYTAYNKNDLIRKSSSSGGIFYPLAKYVIDNGGVVFGAGWTSDWHIEIKSAQTLDEAKAFMGSKYVRAALNNSLKECKEFLEAGRCVLFTGTPCQIAVLKAFLKTEYQNLLTVAIACEGNLPVSIWDDYLKLLQKPGCTIVDINMRSKENATWDTYNLVITYSDGTKFIEEHSKNRYLKKLVAGRDFDKCCYNCPAKKDIKADLVIGDWWCVTKYETIDAKNGVSFILSMSDKGEHYLKAISNDLYCKTTDINLIKKHNIGISSSIDILPNKINSSTPKIRRVGIITLNLHYNIGTTLQAYALQQIVKACGYDCDIITRKRSDITKFAFNYMNLRLLDSNADFAKIKETDYDIFIVGSDQTWNKTCLKNDYGSAAFEYPFLTFSKNWNKVRFSYATSFGKGGSSWEFIGNENKLLEKILSQFNAVSTRELQSVVDLKEHCNIEAKQFVDPTLLLSKEHYLDLCRHIPHKEGKAFIYMLNPDAATIATADTICLKYNMSKLYHNKSDVLDWLSCYRDAEFIITNSYHGVLFSIIFNKPFAYLNNRDGGNMRFDTLEEIFDISKRCINYGINDDLVLLPPNIDITKQQSEAIKFIQDNLNNAEPRLLNLQPKDRQLGKNKQAWLCFISSDNYLYYALNLYKSLLDSNTIYPVYCGVTKDVSNSTIEILKKVGINVLKLDTTDIESSGIIQQSAKAGTCKKYLNALTKLDLFKFEDMFDKAVYLDVDLQVFDNIDELFNYPHMAAVEDVAPARGARHKTYEIGDSIFCSGLLVWDFKNNKGLAKKIINEIDNLPKNLSWHDQNILNYYYQDWKDRAELHLDTTYGLMVSSEIFNLSADMYSQTPKVRHYVQNGKEDIPFINKVYLPRVANTKLLPIIVDYYKSIANTVEYFNAIYGLDIEPVHLENLMGQTRTVDRNSWYKWLS